MSDNNALQTRLKDISDKIGLENFLASLGDEDRKGLEKGVNTVEKLAGRTGELLSASFPLATQILKTQEIIQKSDANNAGFTINKQFLTAFYSDITKQTSLLTNKLTTSLNELGKDLNNLSEENKKALEELKTQQTSLDNLPAGEKLNKLRELNESASEIGDKMAAAQTPPQNNDAPTADPNQAILTAGNTALTRIQPIHNFKVAYDAAQKAINEKIAAGDLDDEAKEAIRKAQEALKGYQSDYTNSLSGDQTYNDLLKAIKAGKVDDIQRFTGQANAVTDATITSIAGANNVDVAKLNELTNAVDGGLWGQVKGIIKDSKEYVDKVMENSAWVSPNGADPSTMTEFQKKAGNVGHFVSGVAVEGADWVRDTAVYLNKEYPEAVQGVAGLFGLLMAYKLSKGFIGSTLGLDKLPIVGSWATWGISLYLGYQAFKYTTGVTGTLQKDYADLNIFDPINEDGVPQSFSSASNKKVIDDKMQELGEKTVHVHQDIEKNGVTEENMAQAEDLANEYMAMIPEYAANPTNVIKTGHGPVADALANVANPILISDNAHMPEGFLPNQYIMGYPSADTPLRMALMEP